MKAYRSRGIPPLILKRGTRWRLVVSFKLRPLYPQGKKKPLYTLNRKLGGPQGRAGLSGDEKNTFKPVGIRAPDRPARSLVTIPNKPIRTVLATYE